MNFPPRLVTILCLVQFCFVAAGFLITRACLKLYDLVVPGMLGPYAPAIPAFIRCVRNFGLWFLLVPFIWCFVAASRSEVSQGVASITLPQFIIGVAITVTLVLLFSFSALYALYISFT
jgi:hypothetical protein